MLIGFRHIKTVASYRYALILVLTLVCKLVWAQTSQPDWHTMYGLEKTKHFHSLFSTPFYLYKNNKNAPDLLMIHGIGGSAQDFQLLINQFSHYNITLVELPGFQTLQQYDDLYSPQNYALALSDIVPQIIKGKAILIGHSMGGNIAIQLVAQQQKLFDKLILIDAGGILHKYSYTKFLASNQIEKLPFINQTQQRKIVSFIDGINQLVPKDLPDLLLSKIGRQTLLQNDANIISALSVIEQNIGNEIRKLSLPTLILWGQKDMVMPYQVAELLNYMIPNSQLAIFPNVGHSPQREVPDETLFSIEQFLQYPNERKRKIKRQSSYDFSWNCELQGKVKLSALLKYKQITMHNCSETTLESVYAEQLTLVNSTAIFKDLNINNKRSFAISLHNSEVDIWGAEIKSLYGLQLEQSAITINGANLSIEEKPFIADEFSKILASVSVVKTNNGLLQWHGFINKP